MKKIISIFAIVFAITMVMTVSAFATGFTADTANATNLPANATVTGAADSMAVSIPATAGAEYAIVLVSGDTLPTDGTTIAYINQLTADGDTVDFDVLPLMSVAEQATDGELTLYVGSNVEGFELISIPVTYAEAPAYTLGDVNGDTVIDSSDSLAVLLYFANGTEFETSDGVAVPVDAGNVNGDTVVDSSDSLAILLYFANGTEF